MNLMPLKKKKKSDMGCECSGGQPTCNLNIEVIL